MYSLNTLGWFAFLLAPPNPPLFSSKPRLRRGGFTDYEALPKRRGFTDYVS